MRSGSVSLEFALLLPVVIFIFGILAQYLSLSQSRIYVHQAAYAAARSALVHKCLPTEYISALSNPFSALAGATCQDNPQKWQDAARWHLVGAAPTSEFAQARKQCSSLDAAQSLMAATPMPAHLHDAFDARLCYAFEPENVEVTVSWEGSVTGVVQRNTRPSIRATVRFRYPLTTPIGMFLSDGTRGDGTRWKWGEATVVLL